MRQRDKKRARGREAAQKAEPADDSIALFHDAVRDVAPLPASDKVVLAGKHPQPTPRPRDDGQAAPDDSLSDHIPLEIAAGDDWSFLRSGLSRQTLRRLRRG